MQTTIKMYISDFFSFLILFFKWWPVLGFLYLPELHPCGCVISSSLHRVEKQPRPELGWETGWCPSLTPMLRIWPTLRHKTRSEERRTPSPSPSAGKSSGSARCGRIWLLSHSHSSIDRIEAVWLAFAAEVSISVCGHDIFLQLSQVLLSSSSLNYRYVVFFYSNPSQRNLMYLALRPKFKMK